jgi:hypothetical protein
MSGIDENASDIDCNFLDDDLSNAEWDIEPEPDEPPLGPRPEATAQKQRKDEAVLAIAKCMDRNGLKLGTLLYALCY